MPLYSFEFMKRELGINRISGKKVLIMGVSYRSNVGDTRYSPVEPFYNYLVKDGAKINLHDPYVRFWEELNLDIEENIEKVFKSELDIVVLTTAHDEYKESEFLIKCLMDQKRLFILDTVGVLSDLEIEKLNKKHKIRVVGRGDIN